jgi:hypothetical protein
MSSNGLRRISIRGGKFHVISDGEEVTRDLGYMDVVIVNAAPVSRAYYGDAYGPQNIRGSGQYGGRACRFAQRLAVVFRDSPEEVYQLQIPATSIFGSTNSGDMGMQNYARLLAKHDTPVVTITTKIYFDEDSAVPKLCFKPVDRLDEDTLERVSAMIDHEDTIQAITMSIPTTSEPVSPFGVVEGFELNAN